MTEELSGLAPAGEFIMFASDDGEVRVECRFEQETLWLPHATIVNLYQITPQAVTQHIKGIYEEDELEQNATCKSYLQVQHKGNRQVGQQASLQPSCIAGGLVFLQSHLAGFFHPLTKIPFSRRFLNLLQKLIFKTNVLHGAFGAVKGWFLFFLHGRYHFG